MHPDQDTSARVALTEDQISETAPGPLHLHNQSPPAPSTMTQPTGTTPVTPGKQLLNLDIEQIQIPQQQQQQPEAWTVWVKTYINVWIQHEV